MAAVSTKEVPLSVPPERAKVPTVSLPPSVKVPEERLMVAVSASRFAAEVLRVPPETVTVVAPMLPERLVVPLAAVRVPSPKLPLIVPPVRL